MNMPSHVSQMLTDLNERQLRLLGGFVALELRNEAKLTSEIERALELGRFFKSLGAQLLIAADSGDPFRLAQSGRVDPTSGLKKHECTTSQAALTRSETSFAWKASKWCFTIMSGPTWRRKPRRPDCLRRPILTMSAIQVATVAP
jgi:hypothetical protein